MTLAPRTLDELPTSGLSSGLGLLTVDLRRTALPRSGTIPLRVDAGVRRTLVALPHDRCVHVEILPQVTPFARWVAAAVRGSYVSEDPGITVFGEPTSADPARDPASGARRPGPTLALEFVSDGGGLVVRDYPDDVDPASQPDWPGYRVQVEPRPETRELSRKQARRLLRTWRARRPGQERSQRRIEQLLPGPCSATAKVRRSR